MSLNPRIPFITKANSSISQDVLTITKKAGGVKGAIDCGFRIADCGLKNGEKERRIRKCGMRNDLAGTRMDTDKIPQSNHRP
jgi:hypothetical protein